MLERVEQEPTKIISLDDPRKGRCSGILECLYKPNTHQPNVFNRPSAVCKIIH